MKKLANDHNLKKQKYKIATCSSLLCFMPQQMEEDGRNQSIQIYRREQKNYVRKRTGALEGQGGVES